MAKKRKSSAQKIRVTYNAPVTLTFSLMATAIMLLQQFVFPGITALVFTAPGKVGSEFAFDWTSVFDYILLFTHVLGHADWSHLIGNLAFILLLGPLLEERYGSGMLALMMVVTAFVTGVLNVCFISRGLLGASGIAFMMILLSSFTTITKNQIPLTFILIVVLYMGREVIAGFQSDDVSSLAHIAGGLCGSLFGFLGANTTRRTRSASSAESSSKTEKSGTRTGSGTVERGGSTYGSSGYSNSGYSRGGTQSDSGSRKPASSKPSDDETVVISSAKF